MNLLRESISDNTASKLSEIETGISNADFSDLYQLETKIPRKFAAGELDKLTYVFGYIADQQINCVVHFEGFFDIARMKRAVATTFYAEPVLGCRFVEMPEEVFWKRREDLHKLNLCSFEETNDLDKSVSDFLTATCDATTDIPLQLKFLRTKRGDSLCLKASHLVLDGGGIQDYVVLLSEIYNKLKKDPTYLPEPNVESDRSLKQVFKHLSIWRKIHVISQFKIRPPTWAFPWDAVKAKTRKYAIYRFTKNQYRMIKKFSKKAKVTITDLILTAFFRAVFKITDIPAKKKIYGTITANLRAYMPNRKAKSLCNLSASVHPIFSNIPGEDFATSLKRIHKSTNKMKRKGTGLETALFLRLLFSMPFKKSKEILRKTLEEQVELKASFPVITNIGLTKANDITFEGVDAVDAFMLTPYMKAPGFLMGTMTFEDNLLFTMAYFEESYSTPLIENFLKSMGKELLVGTSTN